MQKLMEKLASSIGILLFIALFASLSRAEATTLEPTEEQKIEYRAVDLKGNNGKNQLIVEIWIHKLSFEGIDLRLQYDSSVLTPSSMKQNQIIDVNTATSNNGNFALTNGFETYLEMFQISQVAGELRMIYNILPEEDRTGSNEYLKNAEATGKYHVDIPSFVLVGRLSFQVGEGEITTNSLALKVAETSPTTGIKVNIDGIDNYQNQSLFQFTLALASDNANLANLQTDLVEITNFNKDTLEYEISLTEEAEKIQITPTLEEETATMTLNGEEAQSAVAKEVTLNPIGEESSITVIVTAEDKKTQKTYKLTIKRPCGTLKGQIYTNPTISTTGKSEARIRIWKSDEIAKTIDWDTVKSNFAARGSDDLHSKLNAILELKVVETAENGTYEVKLIPGKYDIVVDKPGYLDHIYTNVEITENGVTDKGYKEIYAGDINKDGAIQIKDKGIVTQNNGKKEGEDGFLEDYDINNDGKINVYDKGVTNQNNGKKREIE